jgi:hypothetical protein
VACDLGRGWERASDRVACQASRRAEPACVCLPRERVPCGVHACRARRWCAAAPATTDRNARAGPCRMLGPGAQRRPPVIVYTCFEKSSRSPYCTREPRRRAHCVILIYNHETRSIGSLLCRPRPHTVHTIKGFTALSYIAHHALLRHAHSTSLVSCHVPVAQKHTRGSSRTIRTDRTLSRMSTGEHARRPSAPHPRAPHMPDDTEPLA